MALSAGVAVYVPCSICICIIFCKACIAAAPVAAHSAAVSAAAAAAAAAAVAVYCDVTTLLHFDTAAAASLCLVFQ